MPVDAVWHLRAFSDLNEIMNQHDISTGFPIRKIAVAAVVGAAYAALTMLLQPISYGEVQMRISEVLCILPFFFPYTAWGLFVGCILANLISMAGPLDVVFGSLATLIAALGAVALGKREGWLPKFLTCLLPVVSNGIIVGAVLAATLAEDQAFLPAWGLIGLQVTAGEAIVLFVLGYPLMLLLPRWKWFQKLLQVYGR